MNSPTPAPAFTRVEMTGPPDAVDALLEALSGVAEIHYASRSEQPDARGEVVCTAEVATMPGPQEAIAEGAVTYTVQALIDVDASQRADLAPGQDGRQVAEEAATLLKGIRGSGEVQARVVRARPARAPRP
ncbi:hypothetical protein [Streptomyces sp. NPDC005538]|uniref:hypothetical protein n=1 Tax=Streptomyces sp. NPDC005538 TaxID=3157043 RepID=UPI0033B9BBDB